MTPEPDAYEQGLRNGMTEASLEGIAEALDRIESRLDCLPCAEHGRIVSAIRASVRYQWALILLVLSAIGGLTALIFTR